MANLQVVTNLQEVSWLAGRHRVAKVELDRKAAGLRSARLPRLSTATGVTASQLCLAAAVITPVQAQNNVCRGLAWFLFDKGCS
jgi:hypothetical protein